MRAEFTRDGEAGIGSASVITEPEQLRTYECDGLKSHRVVPGLVVLPDSTEAVQAVVQLCACEGLPFVARGAGTGPSGGELPVAEGIVVSLARMDRILGVDLERARVTVRPGVTNLAITEAVAPHGFFYAPDPSSQQVCTIGGNVAENSGGAHCLKHGFTVNHVLEAEIVVPDGELVRLRAGDPAAGPARCLRRFRGSAGHRHGDRRPCALAARGGAQFATSVRRTSAGFPGPGNRCKTGASPGESWIASGFASTSVRTPARGPSIPARNVLSPKKP